MQQHEDGDRAGRERGERGEQRPPLAQHRAGVGCRPEVGAEIRHRCRELVALALDLARDDVGRARRVGAQRPIASFVSCASRIACSGSGGVARLKRLLRDEQEHHGHEDEPAEDDQERGPPRQRRGDARGGRREEESERVHDQDDCADREACADPELRRLALELQRGELQLEPRDRARVLGDLLRARDDVMVRRRRTASPLPLSPLHVRTITPSGHGVTPPAAAGLTPRRRRAGRARASSGRPGRSPRRCSTRARPAGSAAR